MTRFDQIKASFWSDSPHGRQPPLTHQAARDAECALGVKLPAALLELLWIQNGGVVADEWCSYPTSDPTSWAEDHVPFECVMGIGRVEANLSLLDTPYLVGEWDLPAHIVLLAGDGHSWIALDYRASGPRGEPSVTWFDADTQTELPLAPDFRSFVEGLTRDATSPTDEVEEVWRRPGLDELDSIWNHAADYGADGEVPEGTPPGIVQLSYLLRVHNSAMGGGLGFAVEANEPYRLKRAMDAMRYFGLAELAELIADVIEHDLDGDHAESRNDDLKALLGPRDEALTTAFRVKAADSPADFGLR